MSKINIEFKDLDGFVKRMHQRGQDIRDATKEGTEKAVKYAHEKVPDYPGASGDAYPFKSQRQWWFVLFSIKEGSMVVPYRRSGLLGRSITTDVKELGSSFVGTIGTDTVYAPWVISNKVVGSRGPQAAYFKGIWYTLQGVVFDCKEAIHKIYREAIMNKLSR